MKCLWSAQAERTREAWLELELLLVLGLELVLELELEVEMLEPLAWLILQEECAEKGLSPVLNPNPVS